MTGSSTTNEGTGDPGVEHQPADYRVGYGRPPAEHRFKPGNRANPKGRGKKTRNHKVLMRELLFEPVTVNEGGEVKQMPALQVVLKRLLAQALKGDLKATLTISSMAQSQGFLTPEEEEAVDALPENDRAMLLDGMQRFNHAADSVLKAGACLVQGSPNHES